jgi:hypothetical protein
MIDETIPTPPSGQTEPDFDHMLAEDVDKYLMAQGFDPVEMRAKNKVFMKVLFQCLDLRSENLGLQETVKNLKAELAQAENEYEKLNSHCAHLDDLLASKTTLLARADAVCLALIPRKPGTFPEYDLWLESRKGDK